MTTTSLHRRAGAALLAGAALTLAACVQVGIASAGSTVPEDLYRAPLSHDAFVGLAVSNALIHLFILAGVIGLARTGVTGSSLAARAGLAAVIAGTALLFVCELAMIPLVDETEGSAWGTVVGSGFGLASALATFGMVAVGVATVRSGAWASWRRYAPLTCGLLSLAVIPIQFTSAIWIGVGIYAIGYAVLGAALASDTAVRAEPALQVA
jgi:hypothetical protein